MSSREAPRDWLPVTLLLIAWACRACQAEVTITNNAYSGILIAIDEGVNEDPALLQGIMDAFTEASQFLYEITGNRAYLSEITILVPPSWSNTDYERATNERFDSSDFQILENINPPFVFRISSECGRSEGHGSFAAAHFTDATSFKGDYGSYGKNIVYQWARVRFGVFDESPTGGEDQAYPVMNGEAYEGVRCSAQIPGMTVDFNDQACGDVKNCIFMPDESTQGQFASLLYSQKLDHITEFCDEETQGLDPARVHNPIPENMHNRNCQKRSVWAVIREHPDYIQMNQSVIVASTVSSFRVVQSQPTSLVLVMDTSGSMAGTRIQKLSQGVNYFLSNVVQNGMEVGMVRFNTEASTLAAVTTMSVDARPQLIAVIPQVASGGTSIGAGILEGLRLLEFAGVHGGILIVISDGRTVPIISDTISQISSQGVTIFTVAISDSADTGLEALALSTGGNAYFSLDYDTSNAITEAFLDIGKYLIADTGNSTESIALYSEASTLGATGMKTDSVLIDDVLGLNTEVTFDYASYQGVAISLQSPSGTLYDVTSDQCEVISQFQIIRCRFPGVSETGLWEFTVTNSDSSPQRISVIFRSQARDPNNPPIVARAFWAITGTFNVIPGSSTQRLYAAVSKGMNAVIDADVMAIIESEGSNSQTLSLLDNGAGADLNKDDGIYSAFFIPFNGDVRYTLKVNVDGTPSTTTSLQTLLGVPPPARSGGKRRRKRDNSPLTGMFQRVAIGGTFSADGTDSLISMPYPPGRITDLIIISINTVQYQVTVQWTAQGGQLDMGAADEYVIRLGNDSTLLTNYRQISPEAVLQGNLTGPSMAGTREDFSIQLPQEEGVYYMGVIPMSNSTPAEISNVVIFTTTPFILPTTTTSPPPSTTSPPLPTTSPMDGDPHQGGGSTPQGTTNNSLTIGLSAASAVAFALFVGLGVALCYFCKKNNPSDLPNDRTQQEGLPNVSPSPQAPIMSPYYESIGAFSGPPMAYYSHPSGMKAVYQNQAFLPMPLPQASNQSLYAQPMSMSGYSNVNYYDQTRWVTY